MNRWSMLSIVGVAGCVLGHGPGAAAPGAATPPKVSAKAEASKSVVISDVQLTLPAGVTTTSTSPADFDLVDFHYEKQPILRVYSGFSPTFPTDDCGKAEKKRLQIGSFGAVEVICVQAPIPHRQVLFVIEKPETHFLHFMQSSHRRDLTDAIVNSAKLVER